MCTLMDSAEVPHGEDADVEREILADCAELRLVRLYDEMEFEPHAADADAIILWHYLGIGRGLLSRLAKSGSSFATASALTTWISPPQRRTGFPWPTFRTMGRRKLPIMLSPWPWR